MLDRSRQLSHEEGLRLLESSPGEYLPVVCYPARDGRPDRVVWMNVEGLGFERPFQMEDLIRTEASRTWFVTGWPADRPSDEVDGPRFGGLIFHVARCGSTLAARMLMAVPDLMVHSEPGVVNMALELPSRSLGGILSAYQDVAQHRRQRALIKCTSSNLCHGERILESAGNAPALFIHRTPGEVLASLHGQSWHDRLPESMRDLEGPIDPDEGNGRFLEALMRSGLRLAEAGRVRCVEYPDLIERLVDGDLPEYFGYQVDSTLRERMLATAIADSKQPEASFRSDTDRKARIVAEVPAIGREAARLKPLYEALRGWSSRR